MTGTAFLVDMNKVFEDVVGLRGVRDALRPSGLTVDLQSTTYLDRAKLFAVRPDIVIRDGRTVVAVADVKYKAVSTDIATEDLYQAVAYAVRYGLNSCTLVYPDDHGPRNVEIGDVQIGVRHVDLSLEPERRAYELTQLAGSLARSVQSLLIPA